MPFEALFTGNLHKIFKFSVNIDLQLKYKPLQVPDKLPDNEVFGKHDTTEADLVARKEHAKKIAVEQIGTVADKKRAEILNRLQEQEEEDEKIRQNRAECVYEVVKFASLLTGLVSEGLSSLCV